MKQLTKRALRTLDGTGRLRVSAGAEGDLLPFNTSGLPNAGGTDPTLFLAGDVRANEQVGLLAMHTLFVREHNRLAAEIAAADPTLPDGDPARGDEIYEKSRRIVGALMQSITYNEFLPDQYDPRGRHSTKHVDHDRERRRRLLRQLSSSSRSSIPASLRARAFLKSSSIWRPIWMRCA